MVVIDDLIACLEAATGGSRELSDRVLEALGWRILLSPARDGEARLTAWRSPDDVFCLSDLDPTRDLNFIVALCDTDLHYISGLGRAFLRGERTGWRATINDYNPETNSFLATAATPALALSAALIRAKQGSLS